MSLLRGALIGAAAGAAGTTALNAVTYLDMAARGRPASGTPEETVEELAARTHLRIPGDEATRGNRLAGLGALTGLAAGVGVGALLGLSRAAGLRPGVVMSSVAATAAALAGSNGPMTALGLTDPASWTISEWASDLVPHLAYGVVTAAVMRGLEP